MKIREIIAESDAKICRYLATPPKTLKLRGVLIVQSDNYPLVKKLFSMLGERIKSISPNTGVAAGGVESLTWEATFQNPSTLDKMRQLADGVDSLLTSINGDHESTEFSELGGKLNWKQKVGDLSGTECSWDDFRVTDLRGTELGKLYK